jgi:hypothetical protein
LAFNRAHRDNVTVDAEEHRALRIRAKDCAKCRQSKEVLFRCRYENLDWLFLCEGCLFLVKNEYAATYFYGGTWKRKKK